MNNPRTVNMVIGGLIAIVCLCVIEAGVLAFLRAEASVIVGIVGIGSVSAGGLVGMLANTNSGRKVETESASGATSAVSSATTITGKLTPPEGDASAPASL